MGLTSAIHFCRIAHVSRLDSDAFSKHCGPEGKNFRNPSTGEQGVLAAQHL